MGKFLTKFSDKITLNVKINRDQKITVKKDNETYIYLTFKLFFEDLREYYINKINYSNIISKKAICFDATQAFYIYQDLFGVYCDRITLLNEIEYHTKYFQNQYDVLKKLEEESIVSEKSIYPTIFKDDNYLNRFKTILKGLNAFDDKGRPVARGFIARSNAIFTYDKELEMHYPEKKILLPNISVEGFVNFLNSEFDLRIKFHSKYKLSSGNKHIAFVKNFY